VVDGAPLDHPAAGERAAALPAPRRRERVQQDEEDRGAEDEGRQEFLHRGAAAQKSSLQSAPFGRHSAAPARS